MMALRLALVAYSLSARSARHQCFKRTVGAILVLGHRSVLGLALAQDLELGGLIGELGFERRGRDRQASAGDTSILASVLTRSARTAGQRTHEELALERVDMLLVRLYDLLVRLQRRIAELDRRLERLDLVLERLDERAIRLQRSSESC